MGLSQFITHNPYLLMLLTLWVLPWKGVALWKAAQLKHKWWFIALLILNTLGVLEIFYIFIFSEKKSFQGDKKCECGDDCDCYKKGSDDKEEKKDE